VKEASVTKKTVLVIGMLYTKGVELAYIRDLIAARGHATLVLDAGARPRVRSRSSRISPSRDEWCPPPAPGIDA